MKKIFSPVLFFCVIVLSQNFSAKAQCDAAITGNPCIGNILTANFTGAVADTLKWFREGQLQQVRTKRDPNAGIVAGGGTNDAGQLHGPRDVFVDENDNIYVVDDGGQRVQKWAPGAATGITVAGGNGKGTSLNQFFTPQGIYVDDEGNVYVSDDLMARITKWAPGATAGVIVAGGHGEGSAANQLNGPQNFCVDDAGNIYIADRWNHRIQKWAPGAAAGITVAGGNGSGPGANQFSEPLDVAVDLAHNVYVVDYYNYRVQKWAPGASTGVTVAGGNGYGSAANQFNFTTALSISADGSLYIRDQNNYRIQKWAAGAAYGITVAGGNGPGGEVFNTIGPGFGLFVDESENIFVPELFANIVNKFIPSAIAENKFTASVTGNYVVSIHGSNGCSAQSAAFEVETTPEKPAKIYGPESVTAGQKRIIWGVKNNPGHTFNWSVPADAVITGGQGTFRIRVNWGFSDGRVTVTESNSCGTSLLKRKNVYITSIAHAAPEQALTNVIMKDMLLYPNPAAAGTMLSFTSAINVSFKTEISDLTGKLLSTAKHIAQQGVNNIFIDLNKFTPGIYIIKLINDKKETHVFKCVKL